MKFPSVDIITVNYNGFSFLEDFFDSLKALDYPAENITLYFCDNNSCDGSIDYVKSLKTGFKIRILRNRKNLGYARATNIAVKEGNSEYVGLLNCDTRVRDQWLSELVKKMELCPEAAMASSKRLPREAPRRIDDTTGQVSWCSGGHSILRRSALENIGLFDENFFMYGEDVDLSWRMWIGGYTCIYVPESLCEHHFGKREGYILRRLYYHARSSILLRYVYGSAIDVAKTIKRWLWESLHLAVKRFRPAEASAVFLAILAHPFFAPYFIKKGRKLKMSRNFEDIRKRWIDL